MIKGLASGIMIAIAISSALAFSFFAGAPFDASAQAANVDVAGKRIAAAFGLFPPMSGLIGTGECANATWPDIDPSCLVRADGTPARHVRTVVISY